MKKTKTPTKLAPIKPVVDFEISTPMVMDESWKFRWNDDSVTWTEYNRLVKEHDEWVIAQALAAAAAAEPEKKPRKKRK
jgi:hypothetical protein